MKKYTYIATMFSTNQRHGGKIAFLLRERMFYRAGFTLLALVFALIAGITITAVPVQASNGDADDTTTATYFEKPLLVFAPSNVLAEVRERSLMEQDQQVGGGPTVGVQGGKFGVGFASSWPSYGLSGTLLINETLTGEVILGFLGVITNVGARGWYRFNTNHNYDIYAYGGLSLLMYRYDTIELVPGSMTPRTRKKTETVPGIGAGVGMEFSLQQLLEDDSFPPLFFSIELGLAIASFEFYDFSFLSFGAGIRYRFGDR